MRLHVHEWGEPGAPEVVCLHGVTAHGERFRKLAEERLAARFHVRALDLRGHGRSTWDEPWDLDTHVADALETVDERAAWIGHSFGGRIVIEIAARRPELVDRAVLLDPAMFVPPLIAEQLAEEALAELSFASFEDALSWRLLPGGLAHTPQEFLEEDLEQHLAESEDGRLRLRYSPQTVAAAYHAMGTTRPPPFESVRLPTLLVVGALSKIVGAGESELYRQALGDLLDVVVVPGGHSVLWDAYDETAEAIERFLT
ncbi:MAG TPA: alpha/beta hydrolase [Gaiellaceae bacterium]